MGEAVGGCGKVWKVLKFLISQNPHRRHCKKPANFSKQQIRRAGILVRFNLGNIPMISLPHVKRCRRFLSVRSSKWELSDASIDFLQMRPMWQLETLLIVPGIQSNGVFTWVTPKESDACSQMWFWPVVNQSLKGTKLNDGFPLKSDVHSLPLRVWTMKLDWAL